jgi:hypothetical protein
MSDLKKIKGYSFPVPKIPLTGNKSSVNPATGVDRSEKAIKRNLGNIITPVQLARIRQDITSWRGWAVEAEQAYYPQRVKMQQGYLDTVLNGHVTACMERRKDLSLLRKYEFYTGDGDAAVVDEAMTEVFKAQKWFDNFLSYTLDALFYGYSLVSMGDVADSMIKDCKIIKRWNVSPDRYIVSSYVYSISGIDWRLPEYNDWHVYVSTPNESGISPCGYGILYKVALYEILLRNILGYNADFVELYSQPYRVGKTSKTEENERAEFAEMIQSMGSSGWALIDPLDEISFLETALGGTGWQGYENLEKRCEAKISKIILGHADALDSIPGKLGNDGEKSPAQKALEDKQTKDGKFIETVINEELIPRLRNLGIPFPEGMRFRYRNDAEVMETRSRENKENKSVAEIAQTMKNAGLKMSAEYFTERTGIECEEVEEPKPEEVGAGGLGGEPGKLEKPGGEKKPGAPKPGKEEKKLSKEAKARLKIIYKKDVD